MTENIQLRNPPIVEALIDIRCELDSAAKPEVLQALHPQINARYPSAETQYRKFFGLTFEQGGASEFLHKDLGINGYLFKSADQKQVVQFRLDGFTFSRLKPYEGWEKMRAQARALWNVYRAGANISAVNRLAVRYINLISLPALEIKPTDYFEVYSRVPENFPEGTAMTGFSNQIRLALAGGIQAIINQGTPADQPGKLILDIDLFLDKAYTKEQDVEIWDVFEKQFWHIKDDLFRKCFTKKGYQYLKEQ